MPIEIKQFPCLSDNYGYLVHDRETGATAAIDTPDPKAINAALAEAGWRLTHIFNTHHHYDHAGGNLALKEKWNCEIVGPRGEAAKIPGIDRPVGEGDIVMLGAAPATIHETPGHTLGHIIYHFAEDHAAFVGDTIFALGCGRLFEGTPAQMWASLSTIAAMPGGTKLYCAHEYTEANARFALTVDPENADLRARADEIAKLRRQSLPTVPSTVAEERATNPFLRAKADSLKAAIGMANAGPVEVFAKTRALKDSF